MSKNIKTSLEYRAATIESGNIDKDKRTVDISFSSELVADRWWGKEILGHKKSEVDLTRLNDSAAVLVDHYGDQVGVVEKAQIKNKRGLARLRFGEGVRASEVFNDIVSGIRKNISVGYAIRKLVLEEESDKDGSTYRATNWEPHEISVVSVPLDSTIGVGRNVRGKENLEFETEVPDEFKKEKKPLKRKKVKAKKDIEPKKKKAKRTKTKKKAVKKDDNSLAKARKNRLSLASRK